MPALFNTTSPRAMTAHNALRITLLLYHVTTALSTEHTPTTCTELTTAVSADAITATKLEAALAGVGQGAVTPTASTTELPVPLTFKELRRRQDENLAARLAQAIDADGAGAEGEAEVVIAIIAVESNLQDKPDKKLPGELFAIGDIVYSIRNAEHGTEPLRVGDRGIVEGPKPGDPTRIKVNFDPPAGVWNVLPNEISKEKLSFAKGDRVRSEKALTYTTFNIEVGDIGKVDREPKETDGKLRVRWDKNKKSSWIAPHGIKHDQTGLEIGDYVRGDNGDTGEIVGFDGERDPRVKLDNGKLFVWYRDKTTKIARFTVGDRVRCDNWQYHTCTSWRHGTITSIAPLMVKTDAYGVERRLCEWDLVEPITPCQYFCGKYVCENSTVMYSLEWSCHGVMHVATLAGLIAPVCTGITLILRMPCDKHCCPDDPSYCPSINQDDFDTHAGCKECHDGFMVLGFAFMLANILVLFLCSQDAPYLPSIGCLALPFLALCDF